MLLFSHLEVSSFLDMQIKVRYGNFSFELLVGAVFIEMKFIENWSFPDKRKLSIWAELSCLKSHWKEQTKSFSGNSASFCSLEFLYAEIHAKFCTTF